MRSIQAFGVFLITTVPLFAQPPAPLSQPRLTSIAPLGVQVGQSVEVTIAGSDLTDATDVYFSNKGLTGTLVVDKAKPKDLPRVLLKCGKDVVPGLYDMRIVTKQGITNPRFVVVGSLGEVSEIEPNNDVPQAQSIAMGTTINGVINSPTDVDYFRLPGQKGQRLLLHVAASSIDSRARPLIELFSNDGKRLAQNRNDRGSDALIDVTLPGSDDYLIRICEFAYQTGGPEHGYRLTAFTGPHLDAIFPPVLEYGKEQSVALFGRGITKSDMSLSLPKPPSRLKVDPMLAFSDGREFRLPGAVQGFPIYPARERVILESNTPNDTPETAQKIDVPCELCGRIDFKNDLDWYRFTAKKGQPLMIDLAAERIGSAMDTYLTIRDTKGGRDIANENQLDDEPDALHPIGFYTKSLDPPAYRFDPPDDGDYLVRVSSRDANQTFGPRAIYRLRIAPPRPDFQAIVMPRSRELPAGVIVRPGIETAMDVYVQRFDGFTGPVTATIANLPSHLTAVPALIGTNQKWGTLIVKAKPGRPMLVGFARHFPIVRPYVSDSLQELIVTLTGEIEGKSVTRTAMPASISYAIPNNANTPTISRIDQSLPIVVRNQIAMPTFSIRAEFDKATGKDGKPLKPPFNLKLGEKVTLPVSVTFVGKDRPLVSLSLEPTHNDNQRSPFSGNNANTTVTIPKEKSENAITLELRPNAPSGDYRATIRGDIPVSLTMPGGKKVTATISAWTMVDVKVLGK